MSRFARSGVILMSVLLVLMGPILEVQAGVGGGHSYGGGGGGSGGGGGGGDGDLGGLIQLLVYLAIEVPVIGVPLLILAVGWFIFSNKKAASRDRPQWRRRRQAGSALGSRDIEALQAVDPTFSRLLFLDFVRLLYVRIQQARGSGDEASLRAYLDEGLIGDSETSHAAVSEVVVGAATITGIELGAKGARIVVEVEANVAEARPEGKSERFVIREALRFERQAGVHSPGPEQLLQLGCPSCGSKEEASAAGRCESCGEVVTNGKFGWCLKAVTSLTRELLNTTVESLAVHHPRQSPPPETRYAPDLDAQRRKFLVQHPEFRWSKFTGRVEEVFRRLNAAWTGKDWSLARPFETDALFDRHRFWMARYDSAGLTNVVKDIDIQKIEACRIEQDAFLEAVTVRVHAAMLDYTVRDSDGEVLGGSDKRPRVFSEYWTFVRRIGVEDRDADAGSCPSCAAPLKISQAGVCEYCNSRVTSGEFGWVLAVIDQEASYRG